MNRIKAFFAGLPGFALGGGGFVLRACIQMCRALVPLLVGFAMVLLQIAVYARTPEASDHVSRDEKFPWRCLNIHWDSFESWATNCIGFPIDYVDPNVYWDIVTLIALFVSVFSATVLYYKFPTSYRYLSLSDFKYYVLLVGIPIAQALCVVMAARATPHDIDLHAIAVVFYLTLFLAWDYFILKASPAPQHDVEAREFKARVTGYTLNADMPSAVAFALLYYLAQDQPSFPVFVAGIIAFQGTAALLTTIVVYSNEHIKPAREILCADKFVKDRIAPHWITVANLFRTFVHRIKFSEPLGQQAVVDNKLDASGQTGAVNVIHSKGVSS